MKAKLENGTVKIYNLLPIVYENIINFRKSSIEVQQYNGFYDVVEPVKTVYQRYGALLPIHFDSVSKTFIKPIIDFTQAEIDQYDQQQLDIDAAAQFFQNRKNEGTEMLNRWSYYVYRKVVNNEATKPQSMAVLEFFYDALLPLNEGYFEVAKNRLNALTIPNTPYQDLKDMMVTKIDNYLITE